MRVGHQTKYSGFAVNLKGPFLERGGDAEKKRVAAEIDLHWASCPTSENWALFEEAQVAHISRVT